ncbi:uncharacterized protein ACNLHF_022045 isoform 1-T3 [Anomaloglossus baeobatrachus]|uniref:uncharacterized protein LOC142274955 n=1 Tax=Anomaloglossus baeobatrachus TaxID=238106 RepID=UPI003F4FA436
MSPRGGAGAPTSLPSEPSSPSINVPMAVERVEDVESGPMPVEDSSAGPDAAARRTGPGTSSHSRVCRRRGGMGGVSGRSSRPQGDDQEVDAFIDGDLLICEVEARPALWNTAHRHHWDAIVTRRLWDEVTGSLINAWEDLDEKTQYLLREKVMTLWQSIRDRYKRDFNDEMRAPSGSAGCRNRYKYYNSLSFLRPSLASRSTTGRTSHPSRELPLVAVPEATASRPSEDVPNSDLSGNPSSSQSSQPHVPAGDYCQAEDSQLAGPSVNFPLSQASGAAQTGRPGFVSVRQRQRTIDGSFMPEFSPMDSVFRDYLKLLNEKMTAGFAEVQRSFREINDRFGKLESDANKSVNHLFFLTVLRHMESLPSDSQLNIMHACQQSLAQEINRHPPSQPFQAPAAPYQTLAPPYPPPSQRYQPPA